MQLLLRNITTKAYSSFSLFCNVSLLFFKYTAQNASTKLKATDEFLHSEQKALSIYWAKCSYCTSNIYRLVSLWLFQLVFVFRNPSLKLSCLSRPGIKHKAAPAAPSNIQQTLKLFNALNGLINTGSSHANDDGFILPSHARLPHYSNLSALPSLPVSASSLQSGSLNIHARCRCCKVLVSISG